jgi:formylglycine-generating enzyme required for sulfatase activity
MWQPVLWTISGAAFLTVMAIGTARFAGVPAAAADGQAKPSAKPADKPADKEGADLLYHVVTPTPVWMPKPVTPNAAAEAKGEGEMKPYAEPIPGTDVKFDMVPIPGGKFLMGSPDGESGHDPDESPRHEVQLKPFWMGKCEVTWNEYDLWGMHMDKLRREANEVKPTERDKFVDAIVQPTAPYSDMTFSMGRDGYPAICMTQFAAKMYCKWLSAKTGHYFRLPTEAEWEYACRAGSQTAYSFGDDPKDLDKYAWSFDNSEEKYHKVGTRKPNKWGLFDMHGNVSEWVLDQYTVDFYKQAAGKAADNPLALPATEYPRVTRGGSWDDDPQKLRSAARQASDKKWKSQDPQIPKSPWYLTDAKFLGFRVVRPLEVPTAEEAKKYEVDENQIKLFKEYQEAHGYKQ